MSDLALWRHLVDFGLVVLIWLVQLVVYPSFEFADQERFRAWHERYTGLVTLIVAPLMFAQVALVGWQLAGRRHALDVAAATLVALCWIATFALSVPCHGALQRRGRDAAVIRRLVRTNWVRTAAWTAACAAGLAARPL